MLVEPFRNVDTNRNPALPDESARLAGGANWAQLNTARLLLAYLVVFGHAVQIFLASTRTISEVVSKIAGTIAWDAVLCFFLISGLVIGRSLIQKSKQAANWLFVEFFVRRIARIYPPLLISVLCTLVFVGITQSLGLYEYRGFATNPARASFEYDFRGVLIGLSTFGFRGGLTGIVNGPLWSLALEMRLYAVFGLIAQAYFGRSILVRIGAAGLAAYLIKMCLADLTVDYMICYSMFAFGAALNFVPLRVGRIAAVPILQTEFSYSLYILHFPVFLFTFFLWMNGPELPRVEVVGIAILAVVLASLLSFWLGSYVERPSSISAISKFLIGMLRWLFEKVRSAALEGRKAERSANRE